MFRFVGSGVDLSFLLCEFIIIQIGYILRLFGLEVGSIDVGCQIVDVFVVEDMGVIFNGMLGVGSFSVGGNFL